MSALGELEQYFRTKLEEAIIACDLSLYDILYKLLAYLYAKASIIYSAKHP